MANNISIKQRASAIKPGSSAYNYYMNTPLNELSSREEKLIKKELKLLSESDNGESRFESAAKTVGGAALVAGVGYSGLIGYFMRWKDGLSKEAFGEAVEKSNDTVTGTLSSIWDSIKSGLSTAWDYTGGRAVEYLAPYINSFSDKVAEKVIELVKYFGASIDDNGNVVNAESIQKGTHYTIIAAIVIIALAALWKIYKYFFKKRPVNESFELKSYTPFKNNIALGIINEADDMINSDSSEVDALESQSKSYITTTADKLVDVLIQDPDFTEYTNKYAPELIPELEKFKSRDKSQDDEDSNTYEKTEDMIEDYKNDEEPIQQESIQSIYKKARKLLLESDLAPNAPEKDTSVENIDDDQLEENVVDNGSTTSTFDKIINTFKSFGKATEDAVAYVKDKIVDFKKRYFDKSPHMLIRWMPAIVEMALTVLAIAYLWKVNGGPDKTVDTGTAAGMGAIAGLGGAGAIMLAPSDDVNKPEDEPIEDNPVQEAKKIDSILKQYFGALSIVNEIVDKVEKKELLRPVTKSKPVDVNKILEGISGSGEKLANNIITKAKSVSTDLLNDSEFITFSKKNQPEILAIFRKVSKFSGNCCK